MNQSRSSTDPEIERIACIVEDARITLDNDYFNPNLNASRANCWMCHRTWMEAFKYGIPITDREPTNPGHIIALDRIRNGYDE